jgi:hypothetical protein
MRICGLGDHGRPRVRLRTRNNAVRIIAAAPIVMSVVLNRVVKRLTTAAYARHRFSSSQIGEGPLSGCSVSGCRSQNARRARRAMFHTAGNISRNHCGSKQIDPARCVYTALKRWKCRRSFTTVQMRVTRGSRTKPGNWALTPLFEAHQWRAPSGFAWAAPHAGGLAVKWTPEGRQFAEGLDGLCSGARK